MTSRKKVLFVSLGFGVFIQLLFTTLSYSNGSGQIFFFLKIVLFYGVWNGQRFSIVFTVKDKKKK